MGKIWLPTGGSGGLDPDELTADASDVLKGKTAGINGNDEPAAGTLELTGTADDSDVLSGKTYYNTDAKQKRTGSIPVNGSMNTSLNCGQSKTIPAGYTTGGTVTANSLASQTSASASAGHILSGQTAWVNGNKITGNMAVNSVLSFSAAAYGGRQILLKWQNPYAATGKPFSGVIINYATSGYPGTGGTQIYKGVGNNVSSGGWSQAIVSLPSYSITYYFSLRSYVTCSAGDMWANVQNANATTQNQLWMTFTASQNYTVPSGYTIMDIFCVGGGGGSYISTGSSNGGGGGYTTTAKNIKICEGQIVSIIVGAGGNLANGGASYVSYAGSIIANASGGYMGGLRSSGKGGSGGGSSGAEDSKDQDWYGGAGGQDGSNGYSSGWIPGGNNYSGGLKSSGGQGTTTRAWGSPSATLYSGAGGGGTYYRSRQHITPAPGGAGGGGNGIVGTGPGNNGADGTGGGAGGCHISKGNSSTASSKGGSGIVLLHIY